MWIRRDASRCCIAGLLLLLPEVFCFWDTPAEAADFKYPIAVATAKDGSIYIADRNLPGIWKVVGGKATIFHQASKRFRTPLNAIRCLAFDSKGRLLAGDSATREIYRFEQAGKPIPLTTGKIGIPMAIAADGKGMLFVADLEVGRIWKVPETGGKPVEAAVLRGPRGVALDADANVWIVCTGENPLRRISPQGKIEIVVTGRPFRFAHNVVLDKKGNAYVSDGYAKTIWKIPPKGKPEKWVSGPPLVNPVGLAWKGANLLVIDPRANALFAISPEAKLKTLIAGPKKK